MPTTSSHRFTTLALVFSVASSMAESQAATAGDDPPRKTEWTAGSVRASVLYEGTWSETGVRIQRPRSVPLALGLSAVIPGLGQGYNRQWIKAGVSIAIESALILGYVKWRKEGLDEERAFKALAHAEWSPGKYASWVNEYATFLEVNHGGSFTFEEIVVPDEVDFTDPDGWSEADQVDVRQLFNDIQAAEMELFHPETGASFSHRLPGFGEQQYYELIGKYFQFAPGWSDYPEWIVSGEYTDAIDPERSDPDGTKISVSPTFFSYARDHAHSQDLLRRASKITSLIVVNHLIAAIDAAVFARIHNNRLAARVELVGDARGRYSPGASLMLRF